MKDDTIKPSKSLRSIAFVRRPCQLRTHVRNELLGSIGPAYLTIPTGRPEDVEEFAMSVPASIGSVGAAAMRVSEVDPDHYIA
jgi:hypothetical protein